MANKSNTPPVVTKREYSLASAPFGVDGGRYSESTASGVCSRINTTAPAKGASAPVAGVDAQHLQLPELGLRLVQQGHAAHARAGTATCVSWVSKVSNTFSGAGSGTTGANPGRCLPPRACPPCARPARPPRRRARASRAPPRRRRLCSTPRTRRARYRGPRRRPGTPRATARPWTRPRRRISSEASLRYRASTPCVASERATRDASSSTVVYARAETSRRRRGARRTPGGGCVQRGRTPSGRDASGCRQPCRFLRACLRRARHAYRIWVAQGTLRLLKRHLSSQRFSNSAL